MWRPRLTKAIDNRACDGWTFAEGSLVPGRGQAVEGGRSVGAADSCWPALVSSLNHST